MGKKFSFDGLFNSISRLVSAEEVVEKKKDEARQRSHQLEIENSLFVLAAAVIRCDKNYNAATEKFILDFITKHFNRKGSARDVKNVANHVEVGSEPFLKIACKELKMLTTYDSRVAITNFLFGVAAADNFINARESRCVQRIAGYLGVSDADFKEVKQLFLKENNPFKVLGIEETATFEQVKTAYRKMILKYHPDKRPSQLSEAEANRKFTEIQYAFEVISRQMGKA